jgi:hypothetical protein
MKSNYRQLTLWDMAVDIAAKIRKEKAEKVEVRYHFCGQPLPMCSSGSRRAW